MQVSANPSRGRLATAALVGVGSALAMGTTAAHADGVTQARVGNTEHIGTVHLTVDGHALAANTGLMDLLTGTDSDDNLLQTYCIQLDTQLDHEERYDEKDWSDLQPPIPADNLHEVWWVLDHSYPAVSLADLDTFAGDSGLTAKEAVEATQATIWSLVDASGNTSLDVHNKKNDANVVNLYNKLIAEAGLHKGDPGTPQVSLGLTPGSVTNAQPGAKVGPFTVDSSDTTAQFVSLGFGTGADAPPAGSAIVDASGTAIPADALLKNGDQFWVQIPADATGGGHFTVQAWGTIPVLDAGRVFMTHDGKPSQNLIVAGSDQVNVTAKADVSWTFTPPTTPPTTPPSTPSSWPSSSPSTSPSTWDTSTPPPSTPPSTSPTGGLAHTGADNTAGYAEGAFALVLAGGGLMVLARRPKKVGTHR